MVWRPESGRDHGSQPLEPWNLHEVQVTIRME